MAKIIICYGEEDTYFGLGKDAIDAHEDYIDNSGEDSFKNCKFYEAQEIEIEFINKIKADEPKAITKD